MNLIKKSGISIFALLVFLCIISGCSQEKNESIDREKSESLEIQMDNASDTEESVREDADRLEEEEPLAEPLSGYVVVIDPGHQTHGNSEKEPIGPGSSEMKAKVTGGTSGCVTGLPEYELNLQVSFKLGAYLEGEGCQVIYTRTENDVNISNSERAAVANEADADAFVRIHANGSEDSGVNGAMTICQTASNPYNGELHDASYILAENVLNALVGKTGCRREKVWETDTMSGINWCKVPAIIVEMGYMTNPEEDRKLSDEEYQNKIAQGIAEGIAKTLTSVSGQ